MEGSKECAILRRACRILYFNFGRLSSLPKFELLALIKINTNSNILQADFGAKRVVATNTGVVNSITFSVDSTVPLAGASTTRTPGA